MSDFDQFLQIKILTLTLGGFHLNLQSKVLLCIDDNEDVLECEKEFLESFGYTVLTAPSPEMNGQDVATKMRPLRPQVLQCVDAFIAKDHLASQLLPAIAQFSSEGPLSLIEQVG